MAYDLTIRQTWRKQLVSAGPWVRHIDAARPSAGGSGGFYVRSDAGEVAYLKPLTKNPPNQHHARAANEKIASDLAYELDLNVPPVALHWRSDCPDVEQPDVALSLVHPGKCLEWRDLFDLSQPNGGIPEKLVVLREVARCLLKQGAPVVAFDTWLNNGDRWNEKNAVVTYAGDVPERLYFLDFANTMDMAESWSKGTYQTFTRLSLPPFFGSCVERDVVRDAAQRIEALADDLLVGIVSRIPDAFLDKDHREKLQEHLLWRKRRLCGEFDRWYPGS